MALEDIHNTKPQNFTIQYISSHLKYENLLSCLKTTACKRRRGSVFSFRLCTKMIKRGSRGSFKIQRTVS